VVFDLDGVLTDSEPLWEQVRRALVRDRGVTWLPEAQKRLNWTGLSGLGDAAIESIVWLVDKSSSRRQAVPKVPGVAT
jgi:beta-phosphoglucomutase-like phosphatase (HAD superfamily)